MGSGQTQSTTDKPIEPPKVAQPEATADKPPMAPPASPPATATPPALGGELSATGFPSSGVPETSEVTRFLRAFVPAERVEDWPRRQDRYVPVEADAFDKLVERVTGPSGPRAPRLTRATFDARLEGRRLLRGHAAIEIAVVDAAPALVPLGLDGLAVGEARWRDEPAGSAVVGLTAHRGVRLLAERSGQIELVWSALGQEQPDGAVLFSLDLPWAPGAGLQLDLPAEVAAEVDHGLVVSRTAGEKGRRRWDVELTGRRPVGVCLRWPRQAESQAACSQVRQTVVYDLSPRGVEVTTKLGFDATDLPREPVTVAMDEPLELIAARWGDEPVAWTRISSPSRWPCRVRVEPPPGAASAARELRLDALAPLPRDRLVRLPRLRAEGVFWRQGEATLLILQPLRLEQFRAVDCRRSKVESLAAPRAGQSIQLQCFSPEATAEVLLTEPKSVPLVNRGTTLELGRAAVTSTVRAACHIEDGVCFELGATLANRWIIDRVESVPVGAVADWLVQAEADSSPRLVIRLAKPLRPGAAPVRLTILARLLESAVGRPLALRDLVPLEFDGVRLGMDLIALDAAPPYELVPQESVPLSRLDPQDLDSGSRGLLAEEPRGLLLVRDTRSGSLRVSLRRRNAGYVGKIETTAKVDAGTLEESHVLRVAPASSQMDHVLVHFSDDRPQTWEFAVDGDADTLIETRRLAPAEQTATGMPATGQTWEVRLGRLRSAPFVVRAHRSRAFDGSGALCLAALPGATEQSGQLTIRCTDATALAIQNHRLEPAPCEPAPPGHRQTTRAVYHYGFAEATAASGKPAIVIARVPPDKALPAAIVWSARLCSQFSPDGSARHGCVFQVESRGRRQLEITLPLGVEPADVHGVWVGREPSSWSVIEGRSPAALAVGLPGDAARVAVTIDFSTWEPGLGWGRRLAPALPEVDVPVLARFWTVLLPPGYGPIGEDCRDGAPWTQRLFGPLGRGAQDRPFDPLAAADWASLARGLPERSSTAGPSAPQSNEAGAGEILAGPEASAAIDSGAMGSPGWTVCQVALSATSTERLLIVHRPALEAVRWLTLLGVVGLLRWRPTGRVDLLIVAAGAAAAGALLLPPGAAVAASGAWWGILLEFGLRLVRPNRLTSGLSESRTKAIGGTTVGSAVRLGLLGAVLAAMAAVGRAQTLPAEPLPYEVLVPVDSARRPTGSRVFVPEELLHAMYRADAARTSRPEGWLLGEAIYRGARSWQAAGNRLVLDSLHAEYELRVFGPSSRIELPLNRQQIDSSPGSVCLDGRPVQPAADGSAGPLVLDVPEPGTYRLEVLLRGSGRSVAQNGALISQTGVDVQVPPVARARLELALPPHAPAITVASARGPVLTGLQRLVADVGGAERLSVSWPEAATGDAAGRPWEVEELFWLKIAPGSVVMEVQLTYESVGSELRHLLWEGDPGLRRVESPPGVEIALVPGEPQRRRVTLDPPARDRATIRARFLVTETSGVGNLRMPRFESCTGRIARRWLAVSFDPALAHEIVAARPLAPVAVTDFLAAWGNDAPAPAMARRLPEDGQPWSIATKPSEPETTVGQMVVLSCGPDTADVRMEANIQTTPGYGFDYELAVPPEFQVRRVRMVEDEIDRVSHWSRAPDGALRLFLTGPAGGTRRLLLEGWLPIQQNTDIDAPIPQVRGSRLRVCQVAVFQRPGASVRITEVHGLAEAEAPVLPRGVRDFGWLVRSFLSSGSEPRRVSMQVEPNCPQTEVVQLTSLERVGTAMEARIDADVLVREGVLDEIEIEVPPEFVGPFQVEPAMTVTPVRTATDRWRLLLRPEVPASDHFRFTLIGRMAGEPVKAPDVVFPRADRAERFVMLPARLDQEPARWETRGLERAALPESLAAFVKSPGDGRAYQVAGQSFSAVLAPQSDDSQSPKLKRAEVALAWRPDGECSGVARFDLLPAGSGSCTLHLPEGWRLLRLSVAGAPVEPTPADGAWRVDLASRTLPQSIEAVFSGKAHKGATRNTWSLPAPRLGKLAARTTLWRVSGPLGYAIHATTAGAVPVADASGAGPLEGVLMELGGFDDSRTAPGGDVASQGASQAQFLVEGPAPDLDVLFQPVAPPWSPGRLVAGLAVVAFAGLVAFGARRKAIGAWGRRWPICVGIGIGLFWWLFLKPSLLGLALIALVLWAQARWARARAADVEAGVVPLG